MRVNDDDAAALYLRTVQGVLRGIGYVLYVQSVLKRDDSPQCRQGHSGLGCGGKDSSCTLQSQGELFGA